MSGAKTGHVMVPVPEALVDEVQRFLTWSAVMKHEVREIDPGSVVRLLEAADDMQRHLIERLAEAEEMEEAQHPLRDLASILERRPRELLGAMVELNNLWNDTWSGEGRPPFLLTFQQIGAEDLPLEERTALRMAPVMVGPILTATGRGRAVLEQDDESDI